ncbi:tRNA (adenosine(37)-N6)-threonylcarbamoyltransferase complex ATPase subunit type 1 TsaE [Vagococcus sp. BWB3-3]|uniref:tRNA threonylcarbamoyladenosine biosynthesis protein TsaE n=1 Tax=Vagococcus allomyrinae TaxID=2794353 RepID=A0A940SY32_9ENTE|nr:tRNA (adenosine(37)-N6)-threonylcarbamoyltransferase complex ATPase subunit type 1 TsaE [Vagococcus allomyrinae]MBP1044006.1 tRNA (adenosine(37)-N6)-threonylcarbamoyltransferase complex ATPase subunit type 1 TsaE [Vagococcus allomyrinae]
MKEIYLENELATQEMAEKIGAVLESGDCLVLTGELGAGKTTFTKGLARGLGIEQMVKSPTYTIVREYRKGRVPLFHMDVYRLEEGAADLGLDEYFEGDGVTIIEWGKLIEEELPTDYVELVLSYQAEVNSRQLKIYPGPKGQDLLARIEQAI